MTTRTTTGIAATTPDLQVEDRVDAASQTVHAAEGQLHLARASGIDRWVAAAGETLHRAIAEYLSAQADEATLTCHAVPHTIGEPQ